MDFQDLSHWWEKESQKIRNSVIRELGKRMIQTLETYQSEVKAHEQRFIRREQRLHEQINLWRSGMQTLEDRVDLQIETELETQKIILSSEVDRAMEIQKTLFMETVGTMRQTFQETLREQNLPKGGDTPPKAK